MALQVSAPSLNHPRQQRQMSEDGTSLLYKTYDDYFNLKEEITSPTSTLTASSPNPLPPITSSYSHSPRNEKIDASAKLGPFFFVLSASSPLTPSSSETGFTPTSPLNAEDIPSALSHLLPQPSTSLLEVINVTKSLDSQEDETPGRDGLPTIVPEHNPEPPSSSSIISEDSRNRPLSRLRLNNLHLRDSTAAIPTSRALVEPTDPPTSATAEVAPVLPLPWPQTQSRRQPNPVRVNDPQTRITYPSPAPLSVSPLRPRTREARSMDVVSPTPQQPQTTRGHTRGLSSPFPLPIQFNFAPPSVPGSAATPYSYF